MNLETELSTELWAAVRTRWENRDYSGAVLDGMYFLSDLIREKGDLEGDGVSLVGQAFGGSNPRIKVTRLHTETDRNVQAGTEAILRGLYQAVRNPRSHEKIRDSEGDASALILFVDYMSRIIGQARSVFSEQAFLERVFDDDYVLEERYTQLLVDEIPAKKRLSIALQVFRQRSHGDGSILAMFFRELLPQLTEEEDAEFFEEVSEDLKQLDDQAEIRIAVQAIPVAKWNEVKEVARLRIENKLLKAIETGQYNSRTKKCIRGALGTWGKDILVHSMLLDKVKRLLTRKLASENRQERQYVLQFFFPWLCALPGMPSRSLEVAVMSRLREGDADVKSAAEGRYDFDDDRDWSKEVTEALKAFVAIEPQTDDDLPF